HATANMRDLSVTNYSALRIDPEMIEDHTQAGGIAAPVYRAAAADLKIAVSPLLILDSLPESVCVTNRSGKFLYHNSKWSELFGIPSDSCVETALLNKVYIDDRQRWRESRARAISDGRSYDVEYRLPYPDAPDGPRWHWYTERGRALPGLDDDPNGCWLVTIAPITQYKQRDLELSAMIERRDAFLAMLLHELRNPLTPIAHALELL